MSDNELVAYWNILMQSRHAIRSADCVAQAERHEPMLKELFTERNIPFEDGQIIKTVRVPRELLKAA